MLYMEALWVLGGLLMAGWQSLLDRAMLRRPVRWFRALMLIGKLLLWALFFVLAAWLGGARILLLAGLPSLALYTGLTIFWMARFIKKG